MAISTRSSKAPSPQGITFRDEQLDDLEVAILARQPECGMSFRSARVAARSNIYTFNSKITPKNDHSDST